MIELNDINCGEEIKSFFWESGANFYRLENEERDKVCEIAHRLKNDFIIDSGGLNWFASFLNSIVYFLNPTWKDKLITKFIELGELQLNLNSDIDASYFENLSRLGYVLSFESLERVYLLLIGIELKDSCKQEYLSCCSCLFDYFSNFQQNKLKEKIGAKYFIVFGHELGKKEFIIEDVDVVLLIPDFLSGKSFLQPSTGLLTAGTILKNQGVSVKIIDNRLLHYSIDNLMNIIAKMHPKLVVMETTPYDQVSIYYCDYRLNLIEFYAKVIISNKNFVFGLCGSHCNINPEEILRDTAADFVILGEWDTNIPNLYNELFICKKEISEISNLALIKDGRFLRTTIKYDLMVPDVNILPIPDYSLVGMPYFFGDEYIDNQHKVRRRWGSILAQRGCPFSCKFCYNFFGRKVRQRNIVSVVDEMEVLQNQFGVEHIFFIDYTFTFDRDWVIALCKEIKKRNLSINWNCETRVDCLDVDLIKEMKSANCFRIWLGAESFSDNVLSNCNKQINKTQTINIIKEIKKAGIKVSCFLMLGLPQEDEQSIFDLVSTLKNMEIEYTKSIITFIPRKGTAFFDELRSKQLNDEFRSMNACRGVLANNVSVNDLIYTIEIMSKRKI